MGYGEIPKSCTIENRQNLIEHQLYATIQRKQPPVPPFTSGKYGTIQVLHHQKGGWCQKMAIFDDLQYCKSSKRWVGWPKKVKNMMT